MNESDILLLKINHCYQMEQQITDKKLKQFYSNAGDGFRIKLSKIPLSEKARNSIPISNNGFKLTDILTKEEIEKYLVRVDI